MSEQDRARFAEAAFSAAMADHRSMMATLEPMAPAVAAAAALVAGTLRAGGKLLVCGNGGSAADAQHIAAEFVGRFLREREALPAIALHTNSSAVTAIANDYGFAEVFARQLLAFGRPDDVLLAISTSGRSPNILRAVAEASAIGMKVVALSGGDGGPLAEAADVSLTVPFDAVPRIQEGHIFLGHVLCGLVEDELAAEG